MSIETRVAAMETRMGSLQRQNARLKTIVLLMGLAMAAVVTMGAGATYAPIKTTELMIVDNDGQLVGTLGNFGLETKGSIHTTGLAIFDEDEKLVLMVGDDEFTTRNKIVAPHIYVSEDVDAGSQGVDITGSSIKLTNDKHEATLNGPDGDSHVRVEGDVLWVNGRGDLKAWLGTHDDGSAALQLYADDDNMTIVDPTGVSTMRDGVYDE